MYEDFSPEEKRKSRRETWKLLGIFLFVGIVSMALLLTSFHN